jgi:hypothetical protein
MGKLLDPVHGRALRDYLGSGGREWVVEHFDASLHLERMVDLLRTGGTVAAVSSALPVQPPWAGQLQIEGETA